jgi:hypothetical protein
MSGQMKANAVANVTGNAGMGKKTPAEGKTPVACRPDSGRSESATSEKMDVTAGETAPFPHAEVLFHRSHKIGDVYVNFTVGRIKTRTVHP